MSESVEPCMCKNQISTPPATSGDQSICMISDDVTMPSCSRTASAKLNIMLLEASRHALSQSGKTLLSWEGATVIDNSEAFQSTANSRKLFRWGFS